MQNLNNEELTGGWRKYSRKSGCAMQEVVAQFEEMKGGNATETGVCELR